MNKLHTLKQKLNIPNANVIYNPAAYRNHWHTYIFLSISNTFDRQ